VTAHDGFTLHDLVSYNDKHNENNLDDNRDGENHNRSWNCGVEGPTDDEAINSLRVRQKRNLLTTLFVSQGVPMLLGGDETGRTQHGNNTYCQDNAISWFDWEHIDHGLLRFVQKLITMRREHPNLRRWKWFLGRPIWGEGVRDIAWHKPDGSEMTDEDWQSGHVKSLLVFLNGRQIAGVDKRGERVIDDDFFILFNASPDALLFTLPRHNGREDWHAVLNTAVDVPPDRPPIYHAGGQVSVDGRSTMILCHANQP
jgi:glycogen operon protein